MIPLCIATRAIGKQSQNILTFRPLKNVRLTLEAITNAL